MSNASRPRFALLGAAGYIAPRHMAAIQAVGGDLVACCDPFDSVGIIDRYFPKAAFFTEFERFDRHIYKLQTSDEPVDYVTICSPNHLHDPHIRWALRIGANPICEKPLVLNPSNLDNLIELEEKTGHRTHAILQLRLHKEIKALKERVDADPGQFHQVDVSTITPRGRWYRYSWKGDVTKSGGLATNIGVHLFDMMTWVFGPVRDVRVFEAASDRSVGVARLEKATVRWFLSTNDQDLGLVDQSDRKAYRSIAIDGDQFPFAAGFEDLHNQSYAEILAGRGFSAQDARPAVDLVYRMSHAPRSAPKEDELHPLGQALNATRTP